MAHVLSNASHEDIEALRKILQNLIGTPIQLEQGIAIEIGGERYELAKQDNSISVVAAVVQ